MPDERDTRTAAERRLAAIRAYRFKGSENMLDEETVFLLGQIAGLNAALREAREKAIQECQKVCDQYAESRQEMKKGADDFEIEEFQLQIIAARMIKRRIESLARLDAVSRKEDEG